ncbi:MAG: hypothetical protein HYX91_04590 [Chloroflexi bacterium]|nr:hypothetical protein [Chloroflexota bacterium]
MFKKTAVFILVLVLGLSLLALSCAKEAPAPAPAPAPTPAPTPAPAPAPAAMSPAEFFQKNTVTNIVPYSAGGGIDYAARLVASFWPDVTGGNMQVKNKEGGGGVSGSNLVYEAKADGLTIGTGMWTTLVNQQYMGEKGVNFDSAKFLYIGDFSEDPKALTLSAKVSANNLDEMRQMKEVLLGATNPRSSSAIVAGILLELLGLENVKIVPGYPGTSDIMLALGRGEIQATILDTVQVKENAAKGWAKPPVVLVSTAKQPLWPDSPLLGDVVKLTPQNQAFYDMSLAVMTTKTFYMTPGVDKAKLEYMRDKYMEMTKLPGFQAAAKRAISGPLDPRRGDELEPKVAAAIKVMSGDTAQRVNELIERRIVR